MEANINIKNIERRIKELAKDYGNKGYSVIINPDRSMLPDFLQGFEPDLLVKNNQESVVIEVKSREDIKDLNRYERFAADLSERKAWRFELVFTNTQIPFIDKSSNVALDKEAIKLRLAQIDQLSRKGILEAAFLLCWATIEGAMRLKLQDKKTNLLNKPTSYVFKTVYSYGLINQHDYKILKRLFSSRNNLIHGFNQDINKVDLNDLCRITQYLIGEGKEFEIQEWLENLDLGNYDDIHSLYLTVYEKNDYGSFSYKETNGKIVIRADGFDEKLTLDSDHQRQMFAELIEEEYMDGMSPEGWYTYHKSMEKR